MSRGEVISLPDLLSMKATTDASKICLMRNAPSNANMRLVIRLSSKVSFLNANLHHWILLEGNNVEHADDRHTTHHVQRCVSVATWLDYKHSAAEYGSLAPTEDRLQYTSLLSAGYVDLLSLGCQLRHVVS